MKKVLSISLCMIALVVFAMWALNADVYSENVNSAGDISALVVEIFDGDGDIPADAPGGTFPGDPVVLDANEDGIIDAGDLTCTVLLIFNGPGACGQ